MSDKPISNRLDSSEAATGDHEGEQLPARGRIGLEIGVFELVDHVHVRSKRSRCNATVVPANPPAQDQDPCRLRHASAFKGVMVGLPSRWGGTSEQPIVCSTA